MKKVNITIVKLITKYSVIYIVKDAAGEYPSSTNEKYDTYMIERVVTTK